MDRKKVIVNVGRQIGSGGHIVGKILAERLCCDFYDKEILNLAAKESGFSEEFFRQKDCLLYTSPSPRDRTRSRMPSSA